MSSVSLGIPLVRSATGSDPARPDDPYLVDRFGRVATDLRVSLTDRCNPVSYTHLTLPTKRIV